MESTHTNRIATYAGAGAGLLAFLIWGLGPGLEFGAHLGRFMADSLVEGSLDGSWAGRLILWGGMALGLVASLFLFHVLGCVVGALIGSVGQRLSPTPREPAGPRS